MSALEEFKRYASDERETADGLELCVSCVMLASNGEYSTPESGQPEPLALWSHRWHVVIGEPVGFSWSSCDGCGSRLGGDRHEGTAMPV